QALEHCEPGKTIEFLTLPDLNGQLISSREIFAQHEVTFIMFWRAGCSHCREFEPVLESMYEKYHAQGLGVYAIGTDKTEEEWRQQATANHSPWTSVFLSFDQRKDFNKRFPVPSTPTLIAVNKDGVIMRRMILRSKIEDWILELLEEAKQQH
ncbi:MAG: TlpA family protein disulfide reductase, partial [Flavobacteriales bacterium]